MKKLLTQAFLLSSAMAADASTDAQVAKIMETIDISNIESKIRADLLKELENKGIAELIESQIHDKVTELRTNEDTVWQEWVMLRIYEATQWEQYEKFLTK